MLHAMRVFVRVVDAGSFTAAAQQTETSTAQVSRLVSDLENQLHARLLHRTTRRLALTETGERFLAQCRQILEQVEYARAEAGGAHLTPRGRLRVHALTGLGIQLLATLAGRYHERYPEVTMDLVLSQRQPDLLEDNLDVVITLSHELPDSELIAQTLGTVFHVVCASRSMACPGCRRTCRPIAACAWRTWHSPIPGASSSTEASNPSRPATASG